MTGFIYRCGGESIFPVPTIWRTPLKYLFENVCCLAYYKLPLILLLFSGSEWGKALILVKHNVGEEIHPVLLTHTLESQTQSYTISAWCADQSSLANVIPNTMRPLQKTQTSVMLEFSVKTKTSSVKLWNVQPSSKGKT